MRLIPGLGRRCYRSLKTATISTWHLYFAHQFCTPAIAAHRLPARGIAVRIASTFSIIKFRPAIPSGPKMFRKPDRSPCTPSSTDDANALRDASCLLFSRRNRETSLGRMSCFTRKWNVPPVDKLENVPLRAKSGGTAFHRRRDEFSPQEGRSPKNRGSCSQGRRRGRAPGLL